MSEPLLLLLLRLLPFSAIHKAWESHCEGLALRKIHQNIQMRLEKWKFTRWAICAALPWLFTRWLFKPGVKIVIFCTWARLFSSYLCQLEDKFIEMTQLLRNETATLKKPVFCAMTFLFSSLACTALLCDETLRDSEWSRAKDLFANIFEMAEERNLTLPH